MATKKKDLPTKKTVKGGGINLGNDNLTLVRAAKPGKKDLPTRKPVTGGRKSGGGQPDYTRITP